MCLAIPACIEALDENQATVSLLGNRRVIDVSLVESAAVGQWVLVHAGFAIETLSEEDAQETIGLLMQAQGASDADR